MRGILVLALVALTACSTRENVDEGGSVGDRVGDWDTELAARNNSGVTGTARVQSLLAGAGATINIRGATSGGHHPWHVHRGSCGSGGTIVGAAGDYPPLHVGANGTASATATISVALNEDEDYHVNVHRSPTELNVIIACGNLDND